MTGRDLSILLNLFAAFVIAILVIDDCSSSDFDVLSDLRECGVARDSCRQNLELCVAGAREDAGALEAAIDDRNAVSRRLVDLEILFGRAQERARERSRGLRSMCAPAPPPAVSSRSVFYGVPEDGVHSIFELPLTPHH